MIKCAPTDRVRDACSAFSARLRCGAARISSTALRRRGAVNEAYEDSRFRSGWKTAFGRRPDFLSQGIGMPGARTSLKASS